VSSIISLTTFQLKRVWKRKKQNVPVAVLKRKNATVWRALPPVPGAPMKNFTAIKYRFCLRKNNKRLADKARRFFVCHEGLPQYDITAANEYGTQSAMREHAIVFLCRGLFWYNANYVGVCTLSQISSTNMG